VSEHAPLRFVFYFAAPPDKVWEGFVSPESKRVIFMGAELETNLKPGGPMNWIGSDPMANALPMFGARCSSVIRLSSCNTPSIQALPAIPPAFRSNSLQRARPLRFP